MLSPENKLFCRLDSMPNSEREQQRLQTLKELGLLETESIPVFEEATQTAARFLDTPICILGLLDRDRELFKSAIGLSRIGLMNDLASSRQIPRSESFCNLVVENRQVLLIPDTTTHSITADSLLVHRYGIRAYLGVPLLTSVGCCIGTLAVMELTPRQFSSKEIEFLELMARWSMSEFERDYLLRTQQILQDNGYGSPRLPSPAHRSTMVEPKPLRSVKVDLITQMTQELRTPLTSILGMASMLNREIYGPLTDKQKKYMDVIHNSGQYLLTLVNEILELGTLDDHHSTLDLSPIDIEMLCQQALSTLAEAIHRREQKSHLTIEPGPRMWLLDKDKVRQMLYHLIFSVIQASSGGSTIRIHVSRKRNHLNITVWVSHPWLGDGLPHPELHSSALNGRAIADQNASGLPYGQHSELSPGSLADYSSETGQISKEATTSNEQPIKLGNTRQNLGVLLSCRLAEAHGGQISIQGSQESGYRYVISLPQLTEMDEH